MKAFLTACAIAILPLIATPQGNQLEIIQEPVHARHLDGYVRTRYQRDGIPNVRIEECDSTWKRELTSTTTDDRGYFHLSPVAKAQHTICNLQRRVSTYGGIP